MANERRVKRSELAKAVLKLIEFVEVGETQEYIQEPLTWALYQTWKYYDARRVERISHGELVQMQKAKENKDA